MATAELIKPHALDDQILVAEHAARLENASAEEILEWSAKQFGPELALTVSFGGLGGMVLLDLVQKFAPATPVLLIDTNVLFEETYRLIEEVEKRYGISVTRALPRQSIEQQGEEYGEKLWERDPNLCCSLRKVEPLAGALRPFRAWMTAVRRDQAATRANTPIIGWNKKHELVKIAPLARWTEAQTWDYVKQNDLPYNPLLAMGYTSIGCTHCTRKPTTDDPRSGRWAGFNKTECGLHLGENI